MIFEQVLLPSQGENVVTVDFGDRADELAVSTTVIGALPWIVRANRVAHSVHPATVRTAPP